MKIKKVLSMVDDLYPNVFDAEYKLRWAYDATVDILSDVPEYSSKEYTVVYDGAPILLPAGVTFSDVERVYVNGAKREFLDERTLRDARLLRGDKVYVAYRNVPDEYALDENGNVPENLETVCPVPFESLYIDYICSQIAYFQNDISDYNKFMSSYMTKIESYKDYKCSHGPMGDKKTFINYF